MLNGLGYIRISPLADFKFLEQTHRFSRYFFATWFPSYNVDMQADMSTFSLFLNIKRIKQMIKHGIHF